MKTKEKYSKFFSFRFPWQPISLHAPLALNLRQINNVFHFVLLNQRTQNQHLLYMLD